MFDHEKLRVYQEVLALASWTKTALERARTSILLIIAEGNGRFAAPDRCRFLTPPEVQYLSVRPALIYLS
jgi:hypothetical protein